ncbi:hypothetical protein EDD21DRAFT_101249 [Dissophora ornata]|nr:hypothetical protein EDD21DRAFT_101249 [Dissophora ornata]
MGEMGGWLGQMDGSNEERPRGSFEESRKEREERGGGEGKSAESESDEDEGEEGTGSHKKKITQTPHRGRRSSSCPASLLHLWLMCHCATQISHRPFVHMHCPGTRLLCPLSHAATARVQEPSPSLDLTHTIKAAMCSPQRLVYPAAMDSLTPGSRPPLDSAVSLIVVILSKKRGSGHLPTSLTLFIQRVFGPGCASRRWRRLPPPQCDTSHLGPT